MLLLVVTTPFYTGLIQRQDSDIQQSRIAVALDCAAGRADPYALDIGLKRALCLLDELQADAAAFLALTFVYNPATAYGALSRY